MAEEARRAHEEAVRSATAKRIADEQVSDAERAAAEMRAAVEREAADERARAAWVEAEQRAAAERMAAEERAAAERMAAEEHAAAERMAAEERAKATQAEAEQRAEAIRRWKLAQEYVAVKYGLVTGPPGSRDPLASLVVEKVLRIVECFAADVERVRLARSVTNGAAQVGEVIGGIGAIAAVVGRVHPLIGIAALAGAVLAEPIAKELNTMRQQSAVERWASLYEAISEEEKVLFLILLEIRYPELHRQWNPSLPTLGT